MARTPPVLSVVSLSSHRYGKDPARYPFQAIQYLLTHRSLWTITFKIVCISSILSIITLTILLITALRPQALLINEALPWWAWLLSLFLVFLEAALLTAILMLYSQSRAQTRIFVETMRLEGRLAKSTASFRNSVILPCKTLPESVSHNKLFKLDKVTGKTFIHVWIRNGIYNSHKSRNIGNTT